MRRTIYTCDKCGKEFEDCNDLRPVAVSIGRAGHLDADVVCFQVKKDYCDKCVKELFPKYFMEDLQIPADRDFTRKFVSDKFEEFVPVICREEMEG